MKENNEAKKNIIAFITGGYMAVHDKTGSISKTAISYIESIEKNKRLEQDLIELLMDSNNSFSAKVVAYCCLKIHEDYLNTDIKKLFHDICDSQSEIIAKIKRAASEILTFEKGGTE